MCNVVIKAVDWDQRFQVSTLACGEAEKMFLKHITISENLPFNYYFEIFFPVWFVSFIITL